MLSECDLLLTALRAQISPNLDESLASFAKKAVATAAGVGAGLAAGATGTAAGLATSALFGKGLRRRIEAARSDRDWLYKLPIFLRNLRTMTGNLSESALRDAIYNNVPRGDRAMMLAVAKALRKY